MLRIHFTDAGQHAFRSRPRPRRAARRTRPAGPGRLRRPAGVRGPARRRPEATADLAAFLTRATEPAGAEGSRA
jgi:hypothetical protein